VGNKAMSAKIMETKKENNYDQYKFISIIKETVSLKQLFILMEHLNWQPGKDLHIKWIDG
jgi:hypothetical protein